MSYAVVAASSVLAVLLVLALVREVRTRRAMQNLLTRIFDQGRRRHETNRSDRPDDVVSDVVDPADRDRM